MINISGWLNNLLGKTVPSVSYSKKKADSSQEVEIKPEDIAKEGVLSKGVGEVKGLIKGVGEASGVATTAGKGKKGLPKPLLIVVGAVVILLALSLVASRLATSIRQGGKGTGQSQAVPTPTPVGFQPYKPSVYAGDPEVLKLEEEINILDREVSSAQIKETTLNPPTLDFNINFKQ